MTASRVQVLSPLRHTCERCGAICQGKVIHLFSDERPRLERQARALGVRQPVVGEGDEAASGHGARIRQQGGRCVFLGDDNLCRIHTRWGEQAKPRLCRQAPVIAIRAEDGVRVGVDPGCLRSWRSWRDGPLVEAGDLVSTQVFSPPERLLAEDAVVDLLLDGSIAGALARLAGRPGARLPPGFGERLCERLRGFDLAAKLDAPDTAPALREALGPLAGALPGLQPGAWPVLSPEARDFALHVTASVVWLRLVAGLPHPQNTAVMMLSGVVACAWVDPAIAHFGPAISAWSRLVRMPANVAPLFPRPDSADTLLRGP